MTEVPDRSSARPLAVAVMFMGVLIAGIGLLGVAAPFALLDLGRSLQSPMGLYGVALVRVLFGLLLLWAAPLSRMPRVLRVIGAVILINGTLTPFVGVERSEALLNWFSNQGPMFVRFVATLAIAFGAFLVHGMIPRRKRR
jgi:hypothetical protein